MVAAAISVDHGNAQRRKQVKENRTADNAQPQGSACDLEPIGFIRTLRKDRAAALRVSFELDDGLFTGFP